MVTQLHRASTTPIAALTQATANKRRPLNWLLLPKWDSGSTGRKAEHCSLRNFIPCRAYAPVSGKHGLPPVCFQRRSISLRALQYIITQTDRKQKKAVSIPTCSTLVTGKAGTRTEH